MATAKKSALRSAAASSTGVATSFAAIPAARAKQLFNWNRLLVLLHGIQATIIWWISPTDALVRFEGTYPVSKIVDGQFVGLESAKELLISFPLAYLVAAFFLLSALAHFLVAYPLRKRYESWLAREFNPMRWAEYALSSTLMILGIASLSFVTDAGALIAIAVCNASMNLFGWSMEDANERRERIRWKHYLFGCIVGLAPWIAIGTGLAAYGLQPDLDPAYSIPAFVYVIYGSLFVSFNIFALIMVLQYRKVGRWADYLVGEKSYMILSLLAKTLLAWQVWSGTLRPM